MQHLNTLAQMADAATTVAELTRRSMTYHFTVGDRSTFYLHTSRAQVTINRHAERHIEVKAELKAPFAWRVATDQDAAGVYFVALRRPVVGGLAYAHFAIYTPADAHLMLKLDRCRLAMEGVSGVFDLPPAAELPLLLDGTYPPAATLPATAVNIAGDETTS
ncbi:MAG: hypothetical protein SNJ59_03635 [Aggregatilineales bacterium]